MGPTASGKSRLAEALAAEMGARLLNADAFQVYRGLDIGTAKPSARESYELLDLVDPSESFSVGKWLAGVIPILERLWDERQPGVVVGGTGLYVRALFEGYSDIAPPPDPELREALRSREVDSLVAELRERAPDLANSLDLKNPARVRRALEKLDTAPSPPIQIPLFVKLKLGLLPDLAILAKSIEARVGAMFATGWVEEVQALLASGVQRDDPGMAALGYREVVDVLEGKMKQAEAKQIIVLRTRQYAKRQITWLRKEPGLINLQTGTLDEAMKIVRQNLGR